MVMKSTILRIAHQHGVIDGCNLNAYTRQNLGVIFHILTNLQNRGIFQHRFKHGQSRSLIHLSLCQYISTKQVICLPGAMAER